MATGSYIHEAILQSINQLDGTSDPCDKDDDHSQLNDTNDTNDDNHSEILCAMCNLKMTPTHQCCESDKIQPEPNHDIYTDKETVVSLAREKRCGYMGVRIDLEAAGWDEARIKRCCNMRAMCGWLDPWVWQDNPILDKMWIVKSENDD